MAEPPQKPRAKVSLSRRDAGVLEKGRRGCWHSWEAAVYWMRALAYGSDFTLSKASYFSGNIFISFLIPVNCMTFKNLVL